MNYYVGFDIENILQFKWRYNKNNLRLKIVFIILNVDKNGYYHKLKVYHKIGQLITLLLKDFNFKLIKSLYREHKTI